MTPALAARPHPMRSLLILSVAALAFALAQTTLIPALGELAGELDTDASGVAWTLTAYLLSAAVCTPIFGRLGDMFGKRRLLVISLGVFAAGSVVAALAHTLGLLVAGRVLQGAGGGIFPLCFAIIRDEFPRDKVSSSIGLISATFGIGGGAGLIIGGVLVDGASYHWIFWLGAAMAVAAAVLTQLLIPESPDRQPGRIDVRGAAVLAVGLALPLLAIARANDWGWGSARTLGLLAAGVVILAGWVLLERRTVQPLADVELLAAPARADDEHRDAARRLRHVRLLHPDPAARRGADLDRLRLRPRRHRRRPADAPRRAGDARRRAVRRPCSCAASAARCRCRWARSSRPPACC